MNGYSTRNYVFKNTAQTVAGVTTGTAITSEFPMSAEDSLRFVVRATVTAITVAGSITAKVQENWGDAAGWHDVGTQANLALTTTGAKEIQMIIDNTTDQDQLPTAPRCRVVIANTNAGDTVTISEVWVSRRF